VRELETILFEPKAKLAVMVLRTQMDEMNASDAP